jgi:exopolysaccharide/PEP-CTERM locus tyrosine autokinase
MSLVERALKKLQASRGAADQASQRPRSPENRKATIEDTVDVPILVQPRSPAESMRGMVVEKPTRIVSIDRQALRGLELLPPPDLERPISNQYQQVKRALVASALGTDANAIPNGHLIMLASALPGEGKTFTSINLALSLALEKDTEVLLVDADVAKPHVSRIFKVQSERGLLDLLSDTSLHPDSVILSTDVPGLKLLPAGKQIDTATELLASERMATIAQMLGSANGRRIVLFDSPPLLLATESRALASRVGQVVLVVRADGTPQKAVLEAIEAIGDAVPVSLILNQSESVPEGGGYGYGTYGDAESGGSNAAS